MCLDSSNLLITVTGNKFQMAQRVFNQADLDNMICPKEHPASYASVQRALKESINELWNVSVISWDAIHRHLSTGANIHSGVDATTPVVCQKYNEDLTRLMEYVCRRRPTFHIFMNQQTLERKDQDRTELGNGNCMQATLATLFNIPLAEAFDVHDHNSKKGDWHLPFMNWLEKRGRDLDTGYPAGTHEHTIEMLNHSGDIDGYFYAVVPSVKNELGFHAVVMDKQGNVVHDPHPEKAYQDKNIVESHDLEYWFVLEKE